MNGDFNHTWHNLVVNNPASNDADSSYSNVSNCLAFMMFIVANVNRRFILPAIYYDFSSQ